MTINFKKIGQKLDNNEFIKRAREIHGNKYDYSKVEYKGSREKVCIICPRHGEFWQISSSHLQGRGCSECAVEHSRDIQRLTTEEFIKRARSVHGDKYDYSKVEYKGSDEKVCIICPEHGEFWARAFTHLNGCGCPECAREKRSLKNVFIERARECHGDKYDYSKVEYVNRDTKVCIICPIHGEFWQRPHNHLNQKQGCPICTKESLREKAKHNYDAFLTKAFELYGDKYSFPNIENEYENNKSKVTIQCNDCGFVFMMRPNSFLAPKVFRGCRQCKKILKNEEKQRKLLEAKANKKEKTRNVRKPAVSKEDYLKKFRRRFGVTLEPFIDEYVNTQKKIHFKCNTCGYVFERIPNNCIKSKGCPICHQPGNIKLTTQEFINRADQIHNFRYDYSEVEYVSSNKKVKVVCHQKDEFGIEHGVFFVTPHAHIGSMHSGCPKCSNKYGSLERFIKIASTKYNGLYDYSHFEYKGANIKSYITCPKHGDFLCAPNRHLNGQMCPKCIGSTMEREISGLLESNGIGHGLRQHFAWLGRQELDIYIPEYKIAIECQGEQHFKPIEFYGGEKEFQKITKMDETKKRLCAENGVKLLYYSNLNISYPYQVFTNKTELLQEIISQIKKTTPKILK